MVFEDILHIYTKKEYPALDYLNQKWSKTKPFAGLRILVATPVFRNTMIQYEAFLAAGAELYVGQDTVLFDKTIVSELRKRNFSVVSLQDVLLLEQNNQFFDVILDCAGQFASCHPTIGFVELTRSGVQFYQNSEKPVYVADSGFVKRIETSLGTGDGYFRALQQLGCKDFKNKNLVIFGSGKVGCGIALQGFRKGCKVTIVTDTSRSQMQGSLQVDFSLFLKEKGMQVVDYKNYLAISDVILQSDFVVTATGKKSALDQPQIVDAILKTKALVANMGVEDEFGENIPSNRVLNDKGSLNFMLEEPTHLKYIDASLALHAILAEKLLQEKQSNNLFQGIKNPPQDLEQKILDITIQNGLIGDEIQEMLQM